DAARQDLEAVQTLSLVRQERLDVVADQLDDHLVGGAAAPRLDQESRGREELGERGLHRRVGLFVERRGPLAAGAGRAAGLILPVGLNPGRGQIHAGWFVGTNYRLDGGALDVE